MNVRVCGPNLTDQTKGTFHVHSESCRDLSKYGPWRQYGGDVNGEQEMLVIDADAEAVVLATYSDQIAEDDSSWDKYVSDFWFAPCCDQLLEGIVDDE